MSWFEWASVLLVALAAVGFVAIAVCGSRKWRKPRYCDKCRHHSGTLDLFGDRCKVNPGPVERAWLSPREPKWPREYPLCAIKNSGNDCPDYQPKESPK